MREISDERLAEIVNEKRKGSSMRFATWIFDINMGGILERKENKGRKQNKRIG